MEEKQLKKILFVEDEEDIRTIARIALENVGRFEVKYCVSGKEAIQEVDNFSPDLLLMDVMMPEMDGPTTLKVLREETKQKKTPVIFMTAKVQASEVAFYKSIGAIEVIPKPFDPMTLAITLKEIWNKSHEYK